MFEIISWLMTGVTIIGTILNAYQKKVGFVFWLVSNIFWIGVNIHAELYAQTAIYIFNSIMCVVGIRQWKTKTHKTQEGE